MKTVVLGLFDDVEQAGGVLAQLAGSPLDLETIEVVSHDLDAQRALASEYGLQTGRRGVGTAVGLCAMLGAVGGYILGGSVLISLGPLLSVAGGLLLGAGAGLALGLLSETVRVPDAHSDAVLAAIDQGATAVVVRTANVPTARAIGDLFRAGGSRVLDPPATKASQSAVPAQTSDVIAIDDSPRQQANDGQGDDELLFAPPGRREVIDGKEIGEVNAALPEDIQEGAVGEGEVARFQAPSAAEAPPPATAPALSDDADIVALDLTPRFARSLREAGLDTVGALADRFGEDGGDLRGIGGIGPVAIAEIRERLESLAGRGTGIHHER